MILALVGVAPGAWGGQGPVVITDLLRIRTVTSIDVAADGSKAVFAVRSIAALPPIGAAQVVLQTAPGMTRIAAALATGHALPPDIADRGVTEKDFAPDLL